jgi:hypothetical protein
MIKGSARDKNGSPLIEGDIVLLDVFAPELKQKGITQLLGRIIEIYDSYTYGPKATLLKACKVDIGGGLQLRLRRPHDVELAEGFEDEFNQQVVDYEWALMISKFESFA